MNFDLLVGNLQKRKVNRICGAKYRGTKLSDEDLLKLREKLNDEEYLNKAIINIADKLTGELFTREKLWQ